MKHLLKIYTLLVLFSFQTIAQDLPYFIETYAWNDIHNGWRVMPNQQGNYMVFVEAKNDVDNTWRGSSAHIETDGTLIETHDYPFQANQTTGSSALRHAIATEYGFFAVGSTSYNETHFSNVLYAMTDDVGNLIKIDTVGPPNKIAAARGCTQTVNGEYFITGQASYGHDSLINNYLIKLDTAGNELWDTIYTDLLPNSYFWDIMPTHKGDTYYISGQMGAQYLDYPAYVVLLEIDEDGNILKELAFTAEHETNSLIEYHEDAPHILVTSDNGLIVVFASYLGGAFWEKSSIYKFDSLFQEQWHITENEEDIGFLNEIVETQEGNFVFASSWINPNDNDAQMQIFSVSAEGEPLWRRKFDVGSSHDYGYCLNTTAEGGFIAAGRSEEDGIASLLVVKTNCVGSVHLPIANFSGSINHDSLSITTTNESEYVYPEAGGFYNWFLGNGDALASTENINYQYEQAGEYTLTLSAIICNDTTLHQQTFCIGTPFTSDTTFSHQILDVGELQFQSPYHANDIVWDFGDNTNSTAINPIHNYTANGIYAVNLSFTLCSEAFSFTETINIDGVGISENNNSLANQISLYPNPASDFLQIETDIFQQECNGNPKCLPTISIFNVLGEKVLEQSFSYEINISALPEGAYFLQFQNAEQMIVKRFVINR